jgi:hypothetical protein
MPCTDSTTLKPSGKLSTCISEKPSTCESSAGPVLSHWGHRRFSTQRSREDIFQVCACGAPVQPRLRCRTQTEPLPRHRRLGMRDPSHDARFIGKYRRLGGQIFETLGHQSGGLSPLDESHLSTCKAISSSRALRARRSRFLPCGRHLICSLTRRASSAKCLSNNGFGWSGWGRGITGSPDQSGGSMQHSLSPITAHMVR